MNKIWIMKNLTSWFSIDLDKIETFECVPKQQPRGDLISYWLHINGKLVTHDTGQVLFKALEAHLALGGHKDALLTEIDRYNDYKKSNQ